MLGAALACAAPGAPKSHAAPGLGWMKGPGQTPPTAYSRFSPSKRPGTVRVGIFGCSMIYGDEAGFGFDMPTFLQKRLHARGYRHVEVLNFGVSGYGSHQVFLLWESVGKQYELDYVVVYWMREHLNRDTTFSFFGGDASAMHARYVLDGPGVRLLQPLGRDLPEQRAIYARLAQPWRYWRYDSRMPLLLRRWSASLADARGNPFYYAPNPQEEALEIMRRLLARMASGPSRLIVMADADDEAYAKRLLNGTGTPILLEKKGAPQPMLYSAPGGHPSALANGARADALFSFLTGEAGSSGRTLELARSLKTPRRSDVPPLREWFDGNFYLDGLPAARLAVHRTNERPAYREVKPDAQGPIALLAVWGQELRFLEWPRPWTDGEDVELEFTLGGLRFKRRIGRIRAPNAVVAALEISTRSLEVELGRGEKSEIRLQEDRSAGLPGLRFAHRPANVELRVSGRAALFGRPKESAAGWDVRLEPPPGAQYLWLRAFPGQYADRPRLNESGEAGFRSKDGSKRATVGSYAFQRREDALVERLQTPIRRGKR